MSLKPIFMRFCGQTCAWYLKSSIQILKFFLFRILLPHSSAAVHDWGSEALWGCVGGWVGDSRKVWKTLFANCHMVWWRLKSVTLNCFSFSSRNRDVCHWVYWLCRSTAWEHMPSGSCEYTLLCLSLAFRAHRKIYIAPGLHTVWMVIILYLFVLFGCQNKQQLSPYTALTDRFYSRGGECLLRGTDSVLMTQIGFVLEGIK